MRVTHSVRIEATLELPDNYTEEQQREYLETFWVEVLEDVEDEHLYAEGESVELKEVKLL